MSKFAGFLPGRVHLTPVPATFFTDLLPLIDHLGELKVTLYAIWFLDRQEGDLRYIQPSHFLDDRRLMEGLGDNRPEAEATLSDALGRAVGRGSLLQGGEGTEAVYFLNTARGRAALNALQAGEWRPGETPLAPVTLELERPNIFKLYEENIGPLTPLISDMLREAEQTYPFEWIEEAITIAVKKNIRNWRYVEAVLGGWQERGHNDQNRPGSEEDRRKYVQGKYSDFIEH